MGRSLRIFGLLSLGFAGGVICTLGGLFYLLQNPDHIGKIIVRFLPEARNTIEPHQRLKKAEAELAAARGERRRWLALGEAAMANVEGGSAERAKAYAEELLRLAPKYSKDRNFGNAVHKGNLTLGRLALRAGDTESAKEFLLAAGKTPGSPQLHSFGPNMALAKELLEKGESAAVLDYFQLCSRFWRRDRGKLEEWHALVKEGRIPNFGPNLLY